ncbi:hypothetical protein N7532_006850 [Penicillium argentinense]|uniref:Uncharacterized protein n=1 Tax=Penicillium argentinense TaxID=1131581 RepID=A0A9W9FGS4_9EURO|nr:uncharacterized protein N7532_006850 [Penicillium argentinense]KAJ5099849.1 hypothetical protein N7532_006850 [Penicillium argentinense]
MEEMSNIVFAWMLDQIKGFVSLNEETLQNERIERQIRLTKLNNTLSWFNERVDRRKAESCGKWLQRVGQWATSSILHPLTPSDRPAYMSERIYTWGLGDYPTTSESFMCATAPDHVHQTAMPSIRGARNSARRSNKSIRL